MKSGIHTRTRSKKRVREDDIEQHPAQIPLEDKSSPISKVPSDVLKMILRKASEGQAILPEEKLKKFRLVNKKMRDCVDNHPIWLELSNQPELLPEEYEGMPLNHNERISELREVYQEEVARVNATAEQYIKQRLSRENQNFQGNFLAKNASAIFLCGAPPMGLPGLAWVAHTSLPYPVNDLVVSALGGLGVKSLEVLLGPVVKANFISMLSSLDYLSPKLLKTAEDVFNNFDSNSVAEIEQDSKLFGEVVKKSNNTNYYNLYTQKRVLDNMTSSLEKAQKHRSKPF